jgi:hypothetical protein
MQISEVELRGVRASLPGDVTQPGDPIVSTSNDSLGGGAGVWNAIDNEPANKYINFEKFNTGFTVAPQLGLTVVSGLTLTSANDAPERDPASFILFGAYDFTNLTEIASGNLAAFTNRLQKQTILFENKTPYLQYKLLFPTLSNAAVALAMQIAEVELLGVPGPNDVSSPGDPIVAIPSNNVPGTEGVANVIDNGPFKYVNFDKFNTGFRITPAAPSASIVVGLSLTSANDHPERDPASYILEGSNDTTNFVSISSGALPSFPMRFHKNYVFFPHNTKAFTTYRLIFPTVADAVLANSMQIAEVEFLGIRLDLVGLTNCAPGTLIRRQPVDTPVLPGARATFRVFQTGPWRLQWYRNGVAITGATSSVYVTPPASAGDDGALYHVRATGRDCYEDSDEAMLSIFTPSATESIGLNFIGQGAASGPFEMFPEDITGFHPQAYWNNIRGASNHLANPTNSSNQLHPTITVQWATSGEWRAYVGEDDPTLRMFEGIATSFATNETAAQTVTFSNVPPGNHSLLLYTVQIPLEFFSMDFQAVTFGTDGTPRTMQQRFIRPQNGDEYHASPGFHLVASDTPATRAVGNTLRFDNLQPEDGRIQIRFFSPNRTERLPPADPIRGPGLNGLQLLLNTPRVPVPTRIVSVGYSGNSASVSFATIGGLFYSVEHTGDPGEPATWTPLLPAVSGTGSPATVVDSLPGPVMRFYRVRVE